MQCLFVSTSLRVSKTLVLQPKAVDLHNNNKANEEFYQYLMLLFHPWQMIQELKGHEESWQTAYNAASFNDYTCSLISNMTIDYECWDAKADHTFPSSQGPLSQFLSSADDAEVEEDLSLLLLEEGNTHYQLFQGDKVHALCKEAQASNALPEDKWQLQWIVEKMCADVEPFAHQSDGEDNCTEDTQHLEASVEDHKWIMWCESRNKRPCISDKEEDAPLRKCWAYINPCIDIKWMLDNVDPIRIHQSSLMIQEMLDVVEEVHAKFFLDTNEE